MTPTHRTIATAGLLAACLGLASCSSSSGGGSSGASTTAPGAAQAVVNATYAKTVAEKTASVSLSIGVAKGPSATISGPFDLSTGEGQLALEVKGVSLQGAIPNTSTLLYAGGSLYLQASSLVKTFDGQKPWAQLTTSTMEKVLCLLMPGTNTATVAQLATGNPVNLLAVLDTQDMKVATKGYVTVNGTSLTDYSVDIDPVSAAKTATGEARLLFEAMAAGGTHASLTVGIDSSGVLHSLATTFTTGGKDIAISLQLSGLGASSPSVTAPSPSQVGQLSFPGGCGTGASTTTSIP